MCLSIKIAEERPGNTLVAFKVGRVVLLRYCCVDYYNNDHNDLPNPTTVIIVTLGLRHFYIGCRAARHIARVVGLEGRSAVALGIDPVRDGQALADFEVVVAAQPVSLSQAVPQGAVAIGVAGNGLQRVTRAHHIHPRAGSRVTPVNGPVAKVEVGHGCTGSFKADPPEHLTGNDQLPLNLAVLVNVEGPPGCVVDEGAVFGSVFGVGDRG